jgi:signal transduction histidine kinase
MPVYAGTTAIVTPASPVLANRTTQPRSVMDNPSRHLTGHARSETRRPGGLAQTETLSGGDGRIRWPTRSGALPSLMVVVALIALLVVPILVQQRLDRLQEALEQVAEPARELLEEVRYLLAHQSSELRGFLITADPPYLDQYHRYRLRERQIYPELERLAGALSPEILTQVVELRTLSDQWHERIASGALVDDRSNGDPLARVLDQDFYQRTLEAAGRADLAMRAATQERRREFREVEHNARRLYFLLVALAMGATLAVANLNMRIHRLATEANARRDEVERALENSARAMAARTDLVRGFTHDVKNPLGAADGFAHLLEAGIRGELTPEQMATVRSIRRSIGGAIEIIEQLLDLSRLESGGLHIRRERVEIDELLRDVIRRHTGAAVSAGIELSLARQVGTGPRPPVYSDADRIRQILDNLLANALKYTPAGGRVVVGLHDGDLEDAPKLTGSWLAVAVSDNGPGIPAEEIDRIFDEFHRVPGAIGRGHGLGLAISRRIARLLGGDISVRSTLGEGSTFVLWLPVREEE